MYIKYLHLIYSIFVKLRDRLISSKRQRKIAKLLKAYNVQSTRDVSKSFHVIVLVVDCLRSDHVPIYGYHRNTTPFLNSISNKSNIYLAVSTSSYTSPAVASILTGLNPHNHGCIINNDPRYLAKKDMPYGIYDFILTLPEILKAFGFNTYFNSGVILAELPSRGRFKHYSLAFKETHNQIEDFIRWIKLNSANRTFSYIHLDTLHIPIECPTEFLNVFGEIASIPRLSLWDYRDGNVDSPGFEEYRENRVKLYDSALCYVDFELRNFLKLLKILTY